MAKKRFVVCLILLFLCLAFILGGMHVYRIRVFGQGLRPLVLKDSMLFEEIVSIRENAAGLTWAEYFEGAQKNIDTRINTIQETKLLDPYRYQAVVDAFVGLLYMENEYIRSCVSLARADLNLQIANERYNSRYGANFNKTIKGMSAYQLEAERGILADVSQRIKDAENVRAQRGSAHFELVRIFLEKEKKYMAAMQGYTYGRKRLGQLAYQVK